MIYPSSVEGHVGCFHFLAIVSRVAGNLDEQVSLSQDVKCRYIFLYLGISGPHVCEQVGE